MDSSGCPACDRLRDGTVAQEWLRGTEIERELRGLLDEIRQYYFNVVEPTLSTFPFMFSADSENVGGGERVSSDNDNDKGTVNQRNKTANNATSDTSRPSGARESSSEPSLSLAGFYHAYSLVSSRAFLVDAFHGLAMVPIADAFNHSVENDVCLESDFDVCIECGAVDECEHDEGGTPRPAEDDYLEMSTSSERGIEPDTEVFNTYGQLSNAQLLARYGFSIDGCEWDVVKFDDVKTLVRGAWIHLGIKGDVDVFERTYSSVLGRWKREDRWDEEEGLVYNGEGMEVNGDGRITHGLWLFCGLASRWTDVSDYTLAQLQPMLLATQRRIEEGDSKDCLVATLVWMCNRRSGSEDVVGNLFDTDMRHGHGSHRSGSVGRLLLTEHSILRSCAAVWADSAFA